MAPPLSDAARKAAVSFVVAGKSTKQLQEFLKSYDSDAYARLKSVTERYPVMVAVEDRLEELKAEERGKGGKAAAAAAGKRAEESEEEEERTATAAKGKAKRKPRVSLGYEGNPSPASPRGPAPKHAGSKRKSVAAEQGESDSETGSSSAAHEEDEEKPAAKRRKGTTAAAAAAPSARRRATAHVSAAASKKGAAAARGRRNAAASAVHDMSEDESESEGKHGDGDESESHSTEDSSMGEEAAPVSNAQTSRRQSVVAEVFVDPSLFSVGTQVSPQQQKEADEEGEEEQSESSSDVEMRSPSPPPAAAMNPFQKAVSPQPSSSLQPPRPSFGAGRTSSGGAAANTFTPSAAMSPTPFTQARLSMTSSASRPPAAAASVSDGSSRHSNGGGFGTAKFNPTLAAQPLAPFSPPPTTTQQQPRFGSSPQNTAGFHVGEASPLYDQQEEQERGDDAAAYRFTHVPAYQPPSFPSHTQASQPFGASVDANQLRRRGSERYSAQYDRPFESKYPTEDDAAQQQQQQQQRYDEQDAAASPSEEDEPAPLPSGWRSSRRFSDHVPATPGRSDADDSTRVTPPPPPASETCCGRVRRFFSSLGRFLLRTLLISLMVMTVATLLVDNSFKRFIFGEPASTTVFCPSGLDKEGKPLQPTLPLPQGQLLCAPCPKPGFCTLEGRLDCGDNGTYLREGDTCVLNNVAMRSAKQLKDAAIDLLEERAGEADCGVEKPRSMSSEQIQEQLVAAGMDSASLSDLWQIALGFLDKEVAPLDRQQIGAAPNARIWFHRDGKYEASQPRLSLQCKIGQVLAAWMPHIIGLSFIISLITYVMFQFRMWRWRRSQVHPTAEAVRTRLAHSIGRDAGSSGVWQKPMAVSHLRTEYMDGSLTGVRGDAKVWSTVEKLLKKDTRIETGTATFGQTKREAWTWTGPQVAAF